MEYLIFFLSLFLTFVLTKFEPVKGWWGSVLSNRKISFLLIIAFIVPFLGGQQASADAGIPGGIRVLRFIVLMTLFAYAALYLMQNTRAFKTCGTPALLMVLYALLAMSSAAYSVSPLISAWKGFEVLVLVLIAINISGELKRLSDIQSLLNTMMIIVLVLTISVFVGLLLMPSQAIVNLQLSSSLVVRGLAPPMNSNSLTQFAALIFVFTFIGIMHKLDKKFTGMIWLLFGLSLIAMILGHSRTSIFAAAMAIGAVLYFGRHRLLAIILAGGGILAFVFAEVVTKFIYRGQSEDVFLSMSGRTYFWEEVWDIVMQSPIIGHGFYAAQRTLMGISSVDNTYLEVMLGLGLIGTVVFSLPVIFVGFGLLFSRPRINDSKQNMVIWLQLMTLFVLLFTRSLTGPSFQNMHSNLVMFMVLLVALAAYKRLRFTGAENTAEETDINDSCYTQDDRVLRRKNVSTIIDKTK